MGKVNHSALRPLTAHTVSKTETMPPLADVAWWLVGMLVIVSILLAAIASILLSSITESVTLAWFISRGTGIASYLLITGSMIYGLMITTKTATSAVPVPVSFGMHEFISWLGLALAAAHAAVLIFDGYIKYTPASILVPFNSWYRTTWVGLGQVAFYAMVLVSATFYAKKRLGHRAWQVIHYASFITFILVTLHGLFGGTDSKTAAAQAMYIGSGALVSFLTVLRILLRRHAKAA
ncbi:MAG TPA: hypothetical protein VF806_08135 [Anaerolineaceae bacterium]